MFSLTLPLYWVLVSSDSAWLRVGVALGLWGLEQVLFSFFAPSGLFYFAFGLWDWVAFWSAQADIISHLPGAFSLFLGLPAPGSVLSPFLGS